MKKIKLLLLLTLIIIPSHAMASPSASMSCSASSNVSVGDTVTVTVRGSANESVLWDTTLTSDNSKLKYTGGSSLHSIKDDFSSSASFTYTFSAIEEGSASVSSSTMVSNQNGEENGYFTSKCNINIGKKVEKSSDNALKSLGVDGVDLSPEFNKETLEYNATIQSDNDTTIKINASANDSKSSISGAGNQNVTLGLNKLQVTVSAENGSTRTYTINLTVQEKNPITVKIDGKAYTVMRKISGVDAPPGFEGTKIIINEKEVDAFKNEKTGYVLVVLTDEKNNTHLYSYDEKTNSYKKYLYYTSAGINLILLKAEKSEIPYRYNKSTFKIDGEEVEGYAFNENSKFRLVFALNTDTLKKDFYLYDLEEKTFQRFYNEQVSIYIDLVKKCKIGLVILAGLFAILFITIICLVTTNHKTRKRINNITNPKKKEKIKKESKKVDMNNFLD